jgi:cyclic beta-1,2-glucan synthetase
VSESRDRIAQLAHVPVRVGLTPARLTERLRGPERTLDAVYERLATAPQTWIETARGVEWLLDNHYIVRRAIRLLADEFPVGFERRLPQLADGEDDWRGLPRAYVLARELARALDFQIDIASATEHLRGFQQETALTIAELWALPVLLRLVMLERLATAAAQIVQPETTGTGTAPTSAAGEETASEQIIGRCIRSLHLLETTDWNVFVERLSVVDRMLRDDPAGAYASMNFQTRDRYRKAVEEIARCAAQTEPAVAAAVIEAARAAGAGRRSHVGYHLIDDGRPPLERALSCRVPWRRRARRWLGRQATPIYIGATVCGAIGLELLLGYALLAFGASTPVTAAGLAAALVPAMTVSISVVNGFFTRLLAPCVLPKLDFDDGLPPTCRTLVAIPALLTDRSEIAALCEALEVRFLANRDAHLQFALLTDFADAPQETMPTDAALLQHAQTCIRDLNTRYGDGGAGPFHLLHRPRRWNDREGCWMGWERKRGKLMELNRLLLRDEATSGFSTHLGERETLRGIRFVIVLDADTELPRGAARRLVGTFAHPLNQAELDATGAVVDGYTVLQPRVEISPLSVNTSRFARLFCSDVGLDPYTHAVSDVYQDLFARGVFVGKGIYDVAAFEQSVRDRVPENALLSHDLFEGIHGRTGLLTDVILLEDYPAHYLAFTQRLHRWARGDWQLLPWLRRRVPLASGGRGPNRLDAIARWQILDNLRRSVLAPTLLAFLLMAWMCFPGPVALWTAAGLLVLAAPGLTDLSSRLIALPWSDTPLQELRHTARVARTAAAFWFFEVAFLPHQAAVLVDAVVRTLIRLYITRRHLLQWTAARQAARRLARRQSPAFLWREMAAAPIIAGSVALVLALVHPASMALAAPLLGLWFFAPAIAVVISRPSVPSRPRVDAADRLWLRQLARRTWYFFDTFTSPEDQWLPPDHFQEDPRGLVARRTSPTNIGFLLLATLSAYDFGYGGLLWVALRLRNTLDTLARMERYRGHFFNWYDTATLDPLLPRYVSSVDSGNLVASFVGVTEACVAWNRAPIIDPVAWDGLCDAVAVLDDVVVRVGRQPGAPDVEALHADLRLFRDRAQERRDQPARWAETIAHLLEHGCPQLDAHLLQILSHAEGLDTALLSELRAWAVEIRRHLERMRREVDLFLSWLALVDQPPPLVHEIAAARVTDLIAVLCPALPELPRVCDLPSRCETAIDRLPALEADINASPFTGDQRSEALAWSHRLSETLAVAQQTGTYLLERLSGVRQHAERLAHETDFAILYDEQRRLFHLGYDLTAARLDEHHYDLLASEARLASIVAIAKGDVPEEHWLNLGRPIGVAQGTRTLLSWSGTMFEYLMPAVLLHEDGATLLGRSCHTAVAEQIAYARRRGVPWGMSESGYYRLDAQQNYQYRAFGVPTLGFKRGLEDEVVIAPYASVLALPHAPTAVIDNLKRLYELGLCGPYGLYESVDFTPPRLPPGQTHAVVRSYMAHHQGMILTTLNNVLHNDALVRRFHASPAMKTAEPLLFERPARTAPIERTRPEAARRLTAGRRRRVTMTAWEPQPGPLPQVHVLANGRYSVVVTDDGGTSSSWRDLILTRRSSDATLRDAGVRLYLRDAKDGRWWSLVGPPAARDGARRVVFHPHMVELQTREHDVSARTRLTVAPDADVEIRHVTLVNEGRRRRQLRIASYAEVVLDHAVAFARHPAFSRLFVECEYLPALHALLLRRRKRTPGDRSPYLLHMLVLPPSGAKPAGYETARDAFLGRGGSSESPAVVREGRRYRAAPAGAPLDPVMVLAADVEISPQRSRELFFITGVAESRDEALELAARYRTATHLDWTFELARDHTESEMLVANLDGPQLPALQRLLSLLLLPRRSGLDAAELLARNQRGRSSLWRHGISGDLPIVAVRLREAKSTTRVHELLRGHAWWRRRGVAVDVVIINEQPSSYSAATDERIFRAVSAAGADAWLHRPGGVFVVRLAQLDEPDRIALLCAARVVIDGDGDGISEQLARLPSGPARLPPLVATAVPQHIDVVLPRPTDLLFDNGLGGFTPDGREYVIHLAADSVTPAPWCNVIANPRFGCLVSESGGGYTWAGNSGENRLTAWSNDPVADAPSETLYLRDEESGAVWSPTPAPARGPGGYQIRHGAGYTEFLHNSHELEQHLRIFVPTDAPLKLVRLALTNQAQRMRRITATYYAEWLLGTTRDPHQQFIIPEFDAESQTLLARNPWNEDFSSSVAFVAANRRLHGFTADRTEFFGEAGNRHLPAALTRLGLASVAHAGIDPCAALQLHVDLAPGHTHTLYFLMGQSADREEALALVRRFRDPSVVDAAWEAVHRHWDALLGTIAVATPDPALNVMLNRWLLYQTVSSRLWARTGFYQSSGAFGFRDQLQDVLALVHAAPDLCRQHLIDAAAHQFSDGDVLHWWHPPAGAGIRSRCSDDLLWLPFATAHYVHATGDATILDEQIPFLTADPLRPNEDERYSRYAAGTPGPLYEHCLRAIDRGDTAGPHGLPLIGTGDWNDGMNHVGNRGRGESVWLGQFLYAVLRQMAPLCREQRDSGRADDLQRRAHRLRERIEAAGWDGRWYRRGYYDDGSPLGSAERDECRIDSLAQSWSVLSGAGDGNRPRSALRSALEQLVREADGLILLFTPPFDRSAQQPGYIKAYPPGIRENGGQYTHAAAWLAWALAELGDGDLATRLFATLLPTQHTQTAESIERYRVEPYVVAADVYSVFPHNGRGGWTWYTGAAGWLYRLGLEMILGLQRRDGTWRIDPCIPSHWPRFALTLRDGETRYEIEVENPRRVCGGVERVTLDDETLPDAQLPRLHDGRVHHVRVRLGERVRTEEVIEGARTS